jgi:hypothetical protein
VRDQRCVPDGFTILVRPRSLFCTDNLLSATLATYEFKLLKLLQECNGDENNQKVPLEHRHVVCHTLAANIWLVDPDCFAASVGAFINNRPAKGCSHKPSMLENLFPF